MEKIKISIIGSGAIATALGNTIAANKKIIVTLLSIEPDVIQSINSKNINHKYFPNIKLNPDLEATDNPEILKLSDFVFLATPSSATISYLSSIKEHIKTNAPLINLAKGFGEGQKTIFECISQLLPNPPCSMKGPTFARELIEKAPTAFTFATKNESIYENIKGVFKTTPVTLDFSSDVMGVELISILKNIYAIVIGIIDAKYNSPNLRFLLLTRAFKEMREILLQFGGKEETLFKYCGFGDFTLTALNDLSRNRTLGLFMGKGFYTKEISEKVLLEGKIATKIFCEEIARRNSFKNYYIINELYKVFYKNYNISEFVNRIMTF